VCAYLKDTLLKRRISDSVSPTDRFQISPRRHCKDRLLSYDRVPGLRQAPQIWERKVSPSHDAVG